MNEPRLDVGSALDTPVLIVDLPTPGQATQYRMGLTNFYVLTRYNRSFFYAMSVYDLADAIKAARAP
jgi:membrane-bound lytic murein transglycosylase B